MEMTSGMFKNGKEYAAFPKCVYSLKPFPTPSASQNTFLVLFANTRQEGGAYRREQGRSQSLG